MKHAPDGSRRDVTIGENGREPGVNRDDNTDSVIHHIVESLVAYRADLSIAPQIAESWSVSDEGRTYTFRRARSTTEQPAAPRV